MKKVDIFKKLRSSGLRPTKQRVEIAKFLFDRDKTFHFTVESLENHLAKKTSFKFPTERYLNVVKKGYKDCGLDNKFLFQGLKPK